MRSDLNYFIYWLVEILLYTVWIRLSMLSMSMHVYVGTRTLSPTAIE